MKIIIKQAPYLALWFLSILPTWWRCLLNSVLPRYEMLFISWKSKLCFLPRWILLSLIHGKSFILSVVSHWVLAKRRNINAFEIDLALVSTEMYYLHIWEKKWETIISTFPAKILYFLASHEGIPYNFCFITNSLNPFNGELISPPEFENLCSYLVYL